MSFLCFRLNALKEFVTVRLSKSLPRPVSPDIALTTKTPSSIVSSKTSNVPPPRSENVPLALRPLVETVRNRSSRRLVDDPHDVQATNQTNVLRRLTLRVVEVRGARDDRFFTPFHMKASAVSSNFVGPIDEIPLCTNRCVSPLNSAWTSGLYPSPHARPQTTRASCPLGQKGARSDGRSAASCQRPRSRRSSRSGSLRRPQSPARRSELDMRRRRPCAGRLLCGRSVGTRRT